MHSLERQSRRIGLWALGMLALAWTLATATGCSPSGAVDEKAGSPGSSSTSAQADKQSPKGGSADAAGSGGAAGSNSANPAGAEKVPAGKSAGEGGAKADAGTSDKSPATSTATDPQKVLDAMVETYRNAKSYHDRGQLTFRGTVRGTKEALGPQQYSVDFQRPNLARITVNEGSILCDGKQFWAWTSSVSGQYVQREAPAEFSFAGWFDDPLVFQAIERGPAAGVSLYPVQLVLLAAKDPLKTLLYGAKEAAKLLPPEKSAGRTCDRVELVRSDGKVVLWIDAQDRVLRRIDLPVDTVAAEQSNLDIQAVAIEFTDAEIGLEIAAGALKFEKPDGAEAGRELVAPQLVSLGKPAPDFSFTAEGKKVDPKSLAGKVVVLDVWATDPALRELAKMTLPTLQRLYDKYKDKKVAVLAVCLDPPEVKDADVAKFLKELNVTVPWVRDPEMTARTKLNVIGPPTAFVIGADGRVQSVEIGAQEARLAGVVDQVLAGKDVYPEIQKIVELGRKQHRAAMKELDERGVYAGIAAATVEFGPLAAKSEPKAFTLEPLWKNADLKMPANAVVVPQAGGPPRVVITEGGRNLTELDLAKGKIAATHPLDIAEQEVVSFFRTATDASGKRYYVAAARGLPRIHLLDASFKRLMSFPENALEPNAGNPGVSDVQLADLDGDGKLEICVAYHGEVGIKGVSLDGKVLWSNRQVASNGGVKMAVMAPDADKKRSLLCSVYVPSLPVVDSKGERAGEISVAGKAFSWVAAEDLRGDGKLNVCGICEAGDNQWAVAGIGAKGDELWSHNLPKGVLWGPVEPVFFGRVFAEGPGQWLLPGADGSIHIVAEDGAKVEVFNYGAALTGLATATLDGKPVLIVASKNTLDEKDSKCEVNAFRIVPVKK